MIETSNTVDDTKPAGPYCQAGHAAAILRVSVPTVHRMILRGELPAERYHGRRVRIAISDVESVARKRTSERVGSVSLLYAAMLLGKTTRTVQRYVTNGTLTGVGHGRITRESLEALAGARSTSDAMDVA